MHENYSLLCIIKVVDGLLRVLSHMRLVVDECNGRNPQLLGHGVVRQFGIALGAMESGAFCRYVDESGWRYVEA
jgi:hypothetical protein